MTFALSVAIAMSTHPSAPDSSDRRRSGAELGKRTCAPRHERSWVQSADWTALDAKVILVPLTWAAPTQVSHMYRGSTSLTAEGANVPNASCHARPSSHGETS